jgi:Bardet-Biedl syndrome 1 protein
MQENNTNINTNTLLLDEFSNNVAGLKAFNQCISLGNVLADNKNRLICIDVNNHLKVFNDEIIEDENPLKNMLPVSGIVTYFSNDKIENKKIPYIAVASGFHLYIYKYLKGFKKIPIPDQNQNSVEQYIYELLAIGEITPKQCLEKLEKFAERFMKKRDEDNYEDIIGNIEDPKILDNKNEGLSNITLELLNLSDDNSKISFLENNCNNKIKIYNYITILSLIAQFVEGPEEDSYLIVGTENNTLFIINPDENKIIEKGKLPGVPFLISTSGAYNTNPNIIIADRGCNIYIMKKTKVSKTIVVSQPMVNLLSTEKSIYIGTIAQNYIGLKKTGDQEFCINQPNVITSMELAQREINETLILIATKDSELRIYSHKNLCHILKIGDNIFGMKFGTLGTKKECIIMCTYGGALLVKSFNPEAFVSKTKYKEENKSAGENVKIDIPKKPPLYRDFVQREKESKTEIQKRFITDLIRIKYKAMDTYVKILKKGNAPQNFSNSSNLKISASLEGLGPNFKLNIIFNNIGKKPIYGAVLTLDFNRKIYSFKKENIQLSVIMPNVPINYSLPFKNISENGSSGNIKLLVISKNEIIPLIQTNIKVPVSELDIL